MKRPKFSNTVMTGEVIEAADPSDTTIQTSFELAPRRKLTVEEIEGGTHSAADGEHAHLG